jgi:hypothetical protein
MPLTSQLLIYLPFHNVAQENKSVYLILYISYLVCSFVSKVYLICTLELKYAEESLSLTREEKQESSLESTLFTFLLLTLVICLPQSFMAFSE